MSTGNLEGDRQPIMAWVEKCLEDTAVCGRVLEIGSKWETPPQWCPSQLFLDRLRFPEYVGLDIRAGVGVDVICNSNALPYESRRWDVVLCAEMLEHDLKFWRTLEESWRVLSAGGHIIISTRGIRFPQHNYPSDYYRFTKESLQDLLTVIGFNDVRSSEHAPSSGIFAIGRK